MCTDTPESTTNSRSPVLFGDNQPATSRCEKRSFVRILELMNVFRPNLTLLCGHIVLGSRSPHVIFPEL